MYLNRIQQMVSGELAGEGLQTGFSRHGLPPPRELGFYALREHLNSVQRMVSGGYCEGLFPDTVCWTRLRNTWNIPHPAPRKHKKKRTENTPKMANFAFFFWFLFQIFGAWNGVFAFFFFFLRDSGVFGSVPGPQACKPSDAIFLQLWLRFSDASERRAAIFCTDAKQDTVNVGVKAPKSLQIANAMENR